MGVRMQVCPERIAAMIEDLGSRVMDRRARLTIIDMQPEREFGDCAMCGNYRKLNRAVGWYCGPVPQAPGERVPEWGPDAIAGGMRVCRECHDGFYGGFSS